MAESKRKEIITTCAVLLVIVLIVVGVFAFDKKPAMGSASTDDQTSSTLSTDSTANADTPTQTTNVDTNFNDGNYTATGKYGSPGGPASIIITVSLKDGVITDTSAEEGPADGLSKQYQDEFVANYKKQVVGKSISSLKLSRVSGASLTTQGFNTAIELIRSKAQA